MSGFEPLWNENGGRGFSREPNVFFKTHQLNLNRLSRCLQNLQPQFWRWERGCFPSFHVWSQPKVPGQGGESLPASHIFLKQLNCTERKPRPSFFSGLCMYFQVSVYFAWSALTLWFLLVFSSIVAGELWPLPGFMVELPLSEEAQGRFSNTGVPGQKQGQNFFAFPSHSIPFISCFLSSGLFFSSSCPASCGCSLPPVPCRGMELPSLALCQDAIYVPLLTNFLHICTYYQKTWRAIKLIYYPL